jgi:hypothetical protein
MRNRFSHGVSARREPFTRTTLSQLVSGSDAEAYTINNKEYDHVVAAF